MNENSENFEALHKLLALKRHETPPPGYFDRLPGQILSRLQEPEPEPSFLTRLLASFILRPAFAYSMGLFFCAALTVGVVYSVRVGPTQTANQIQPQDNSWGFTVASTLTGNQQQTPPLHGAGFNGLDATNAQPSLFQGPVSRTETVNFVDKR